MFNTETEKLHRKESFHIFLNLLLTLKPLPKELEHFLEIKKYLKSQLSSSSDTNMSSYEPSYSLYSRPSIDDDTLSINSDTLPTTTTTTTASKTNKITSSSSSNTVPIWTLTPIALFAYIILFSTWVGSVIWLSLKGIRTLPSFITSFFNHIIRYRTTRKIIMDKCCSTTYCTVSIKTRS